MSKTFQYTKKTATRTLAILTRFLESLDENKVWDIQIKQYREKRSLDANAYCWYLCEELAKVLGLTKEQVYRQHIKEVGVFDFLAIPEKALKKFQKVWESRGIGWVIEVMDDCKIDGCKKICCYYGSSTYDTKQMSRLIDNIVQDCKACEIETLPPAKLEIMKREWG